MHMKGFGERLAKLLEIEGYTQRELANMIGVTEAALSRYLKDEREPKMEIIANIATALNTTTDYLLTGKDDTESFEETYRLVARGTSMMTDEEKMKLMKVLMNNGR
ncbi:MAG: helix-turn-helix transcriptional regulator [Lachnospiraceae bacterium]|nr:helix-turn-helix transcriptional regulator [Lachnospiraceae bacterium]